MNESPTADTINEHVREVAAHLPFPVELDADMGGTFTLQIDLGRRGRTDDPRDTAGIDPEPDSRWWLDIEGGMKTHISNFGVDAKPRGSRRLGCGHSAHRRMPCRSRRGTHERDTSRLLPECTNR